MLVLCLTSILLSQESLETGLVTVVTREGPRATIYPETHRVL